MNTRKNLKSRLGDNRGLLLTVAVVPWVLTGPLGLGDGPKIVVNGRQVSPVIEDENTPEARIAKILAQERAEADVWMREEKARRESHGKWARWLSMATLPGLWKTGRELPWSEWLVKSKVLPAPKGTAIAGIDPNARLQPVLTARLDTKQLFVYVDSLPIVDPLNDEWIPRAVAIPAADVLLDLSTSIAAANVGGSDEALPEPEAPAGPEEAVVRTLDNMPRGEWLKVQGFEPASSSTPSSSLAAATKTREALKDIMAHPEEAEAQGSSSSEGTSVSLASVATNKEFLNEAWVSFDEGKKVWQATWPRPGVFHYGMVLLPALAKRMEAGQSVNFEIQGEQAQITKRDDGQLMVSRAGQARLVNALDIKHLLEQQIQSDGMLMFLDSQGNLVLQATGDSAVAMANAKTVGG